jgi:hypothetical protein
MRNPVARVPGELRLESSQFPRSSKGQIVIVEKE